MAQFGQSVGPKSLISFSWRDRIRQGVCAIQGFLLIEFDLRQMAPSVGIRDIFNIHHKTCFDKISLHK